MKNNKTKKLLAFSFLALLMLSSLVLAQGSTKVAFTSDTKFNNEVIYTTATSTGSGGSGGSGGSSISSDLIYERTIGESYAPVTIEMYTDFQDPFSAKWYKETYPLLKEKYIDSGKVKLIIKNYPLSFHSDAQNAAKAALCAAQNSVDYPYENPLYHNTFYGYIDFLYNNQEDLDLASLKRYAGIMGVEPEDFEECLSSDFTMKMINSEISQGTDKGVQGIPSFFINGKLIQGSLPYSTFEKYIDTALTVKTTAISKEHVKCVFENTKSNQKCYTNEFSCSGSFSCVSDVAGKTGTKLTWKSSCGNYAYTVIDGSDESVYFDCSDQKEPVEEYISVYLNNKFELSRKHSAKVVDYNNMLIEFYRVTESDSNKLTADFNVKLNDDEHNYQLEVGGFAQLDEVRVHLISLERTGNYLEYPNDDLRDWVATFLVDPIKDDPDQSNLVNVEISPEKQYSKEGYATYEVIIYDNHKDYSDCIPGNGKVCAYPAYTYNLNFNSEQNMDGEFDNNQVMLKAGEKSVVKLKVYTKDKGTNIFSVTAKGEDSKSSAKGALIYGEEVPSEPSSYFNGQGFALSAEKKAGAIVDLHFIKNGETITGKFNLENTNYKIDGSISGSLVTFKIYSTDNTNEVGKFTGTISEFETFLLLQGNLVSSQKNNLGTWYITAFSQKEKSFVVINDKEVIDMPTTKNVKINEIVSLPSSELTDSGEAKQIYVQPVGVKTNKFLGLFPTGQKELITKVFKDGESITVSIKPFGKTIIDEKYEISIDSSLDNPEDIDLTVKKI